MQVLKSVKTQLLIFAPMLTRIQSLAKQWAPDFINIRHHLHANPELSYKEYNTSLFVQEELKKIGIPFVVLAETGVIGLINGRKSSRVIALRADMDALPISEKNDVAYKSKNAGIMHACGHDVHTTCLLGAARILHELRNEWDGTIKLIFQPGEEKNPGGASLLIKEGVLENPKPDCIVALHVNPQLETGRLSFRGGKVMASADELYFTINAKGGHAATPQSTADPILIASHLIVSLQQVISRRRSPFIPSVLSITSIQGGHTTNVIPSEVKLMGTFRAMDEGWRKEAHKIIAEHSQQLVQSMGGTLDLHIDVGYPAVYNNEELTLGIRHHAEAFIGKENVEETELRMGAEDFGYYSQLIPGCFFRLGTRNEARGIISGVHTPTFDIDENAIEIGAGVMAWIGAWFKL